MQEVVANIDHIKFDIEYAIEQQLGVQPLPFTGMDSKLYEIVSCLLKCILFVQNKPLVWMCKCNSYMLCTSHHNAAEVDEYFKLSE